MNAPVQVDHITIRPMQAEDLPQVQAIDRVSFSLPWPARSYQFELNENPDSLLWAAEIESPDGQQRVVGMIVVWLIVDEAHIATIAVHPDYRGRGIAQRLLQIALITAIQLGSDSATLEVRASNEIAQDLYRRFQFEVVGRRTRYYRDNNEDAIIMTVSGLGGRSGRAYLAWLRREGWKSWLPATAGMESNQECMNE